MSLFLPPPPLHRNQLPPTLPPTTRTTPHASTPLKIGPYRNITPLCLGTWSWGNRLLYNYTPQMDTLLYETFQTAITRGINLIDTADSYGTFRYNGRAEKLLGQFLHDAPSDILIASKFAPYPWRLTRASIVEAAQRSAERLQRPVDIGQLHWSTSGYAPWQERVLWDGVADAREQGLIREIGVSNYGPKQLRRVVDYLERERGVKVVLAQTQLSLVHQDALRNGMREVARELGVALLGYSPLCLGMLGGKGKGGARGVLFRQLGGGGRVVEVLKRVGGERGVSEATVAIAWCLRKGVGVICGARGRGYVEDAVGALDFKLSQGEVERLEGAAERSPKMIANAFQTE